MATIGSAALIPVWGKTRNATVSVRGSSGWLHRSGTSTDPHRAPEPSRHGPTRNPLGAGATGAGLDAADGGDARLGASFPDAVQDTSARTTRTELRSGRLLRGRASDCCGGCAPAPRDPAPPSVAGRRRRSG